MNAKLNEKAINLRREFEKIISMNKLPLVLSSNTIVDDDEASFALLSKGDDVYCIYNIIFIDRENSKLMDMYFTIIENTPPEMLQYVVIATFMVFEGLSFSKANEKATELISAMYAEKKAIIPMTNYTYCVASRNMVLIRTYIEREKYVYERGFIDVPAALTGIVLGVDYSPSSLNIYSVENNMGEVYEVVASKELFGEKIKLLGNYTFCGRADSAWDDDSVGRLYLEYIKDDYNVNSSVMKKASFNEMNGREFELFTERLLKANGFDDVEVTKASGDFGVDVIAYKDEVKYAIQCKRYTGAVGIDAVQEIIAAKTMNNCHVAVVLTNSRFTDSAVTLARANAVLLWDGDKLSKMTEKINEN